MDRPAALAGRLRLLAGACAALLAGAAFAQDPAPFPKEAAWLAASNHTLDRLRGGFDLGAGLVVSFGISRSVLINGQLVAATSFQVGDLGKLTPAQAQALGQQLAPQVVRNGPGNTVDARAALPALATYVQNSLDQQIIGSQTVIEATTSGLSVVKGLNLQSTLNDSVNNAIRNR